MKRDDISTVIDILKACARIQEFVSGFERETFVLDARTQSAVIHQILIVGEAVGRLSHSFRDINDDIPWHAIIGMRNRLIHGYDVVDVDEVWNTAIRDIPELIPLLSPLA